MTFFQLLQKRKKTKKNKVSTSLLRGINKKIWLICTSLLLYPSFLSHQVRAQTTPTPNPPLSGDFCAPEANFLFILDRSLSVNSTERGQQREALEDTLQALIDDGIQGNVAIVAFATSANTLLSFTKYDSDNDGELDTSVTNALNNYENGTGPASNLGSFTNWDAAFEEAWALQSSQSSQPIIPQALFFLTDGQPNRPDPPDTAAARINLAVNDANEFKALGTHIYGVNIDPNATTFTPAEFSDFPPILDGSNTERFPDDTPDIRTADYLEIENYPTLVEDFPILFGQICDDLTDYGDAPDTAAGTGPGNYRTLASDNGPRNVIIDGLSIGTPPDSDADGFSNGNDNNNDATDDDAKGTVTNNPGDEGQISLAPLTASDSTYAINNIAVTNSTGSNATLIGWIDFDGDGSFDEGERATTTVSNGTTSASLSWNSIPDDIKVGETYARFRLASATDITLGINGGEDEASLGFIKSGEVEDYQLSITATPPTGNICYVVADAPNPDTLYKVGTTEGIEQVGSLGTNDVEAIAYDANIETLYGANANQLGIINQITGVFTNLSSTFGSGNGEAGSQTFGDVDGLAFQPSTGKLFGSVRRSGSNDLLIQIDPATGTHVPDAFGNGVDYLVIAPALGQMAQPDIDDLAFDTQNGKLYAITNGGGADLFVEINLTTGAYTVISTIGATDVEGLGDFDNGTIYATTGTGGDDANDNSFYSINKATDVITKITDLDDFFPGTDYEAVDCIKTPIASDPNVLLVKRITAVNDENFAAVIDPTTTPDDEDNNPNWPSNYLQGLTNTAAAPGDTVDYTIYFLNAGNAAATNVKICDLLSEFLDYVPNTYSSAPDEGIQLSFNGVTDLTGANDIDAGEFISAGIAPTGCVRFNGSNFVPIAAADNQNGTVTVDLNSIAPATGPGDDPADPFGFIRFRARVK